MSALEALAQAVLDGRVYLESSKPYGTYGATRTEVVIRPKPEETPK